MAMALRGYANARSFAMKMSPMKMLVIAGSFALAASAYAGDVSMDTDQDGSVSPTEHAAGAKKMFEKMDADGDGIVTAQEMSSAHKDMPTARSDEGASESATGTASRLGKSDRPKSSASKIKAIDTDGDGAITAAEHEAGARKMFDKMDKDHNGKLSAAEIQAGHEKMLTAGDE
jgi:Ca2+-binding EF-hand superfamily protein